MKKAISVLVLALLANVAHASPVSDYCEATASLAKTMAEGRDKGVSMNDIRKWAYESLEDMHLSKASLADPKKDVDFLSEQVYVVGYSMSQAEVHKTVFAGCMAGSQKADAAKNMIVPPAVTH